MGSYYFTHILDELSDTDVEVLSDWYNHDSIAGNFLESGTKETMQALMDWATPNSNLNQVFVCREIVGGLPIGILRVYRAPNVEVQHNATFDMMVSPDHQGNGYGTQLIEYMEKWLKKNWETENLYLEVYEGNPAIKLYNKLGFKLCGECPNYFKTGRKKLIMWKSL